MSTSEAPVCASTGHGVNRLSIGASLIQYFKSCHYQRTLVPESANSWSFLNLVENVIRNKATNLKKNYLNPVGIFETRTEWQMNYLICYILLFPVFSILWCIHRDYRLDDGKVYQSLDHLQIWLHSSRTQKWHTLLGSIQIPFLLAWNLIKVKIVSAHKVLGSAIEFIFSCLISKVLP